MPAFSNYLERAAMNHILAQGRAQTFTPPANLYVALFTSSGGLENNTAGEQTEVSGGSYARQHLDGSANYFVAIAPGAADGATSNFADIVWPTATGDWGNVTHVAIMDSGSSGNVLIWGALTSPKTIETGDQFKISANNLTLTLD